MMTLKKEIKDLLIGRSLTISVAESCTGGRLSSMLTDSPKSSAYFDSSVVCYSEESKTELLRISRGLIRRYGTVSARVAGLMAVNVRKLRKTDLGLAITGVAGPDTIEKKKTGTVYIAVSSDERNSIKKFSFKGSRKEVKEQASKAALRLLRGFIKH